MVTIVAKPITCVSCLKLALPVVVDGGRPLVKRVPSMAMLTLLPAWPQLGGGGLNFGYVGECVSETHINLLATLENIRLTEPTYI